MDLRDDRSILVLFGTETGNSQEISEHIGRMCERLRFHTSVEGMDDMKLNDLLHNHALIIFVISTTGQGDFPQNSLQFWKSLRRAKLPPGCLAAVKFTTLGLGDSSYPKFNWAARQLHSRLQKLGAKEAFPRGESDERHDNGIDSIYRPWHEDLRTHLLAEFPLPGSVQPIPDDQPLPPKYILRLVTKMAPAVVNSTVGKDLAHQEKHREDGDDLADRQKSAAMSHIDATVSAGAAQWDEEWRRMSISGNTPILARLSEASSDMALEGRSLASLEKANVLKDFPSKYRLETAAPDDILPPSQLLPIPESFSATLTENVRLTPDSHWQDVRLLSINLHLPKTYKRGFQTNPGTTMTLYPKNFPRDVEWLIDQMDWDDIADIPVEFDLLKPRRTPGKVHLSLLPKGLWPLANATLRDLLTHNFDITAIPSRTFLEKISQYSEDARHKEKLVDLTRLINTQEFYDFTSRPRRTILEVLEEFDSVKIPFHVVPDLFPVIRGREFSIANGGSTMETSNDRMLCCELLVALVEYKTVIRKPRQGLCSRYLKHLPDNTRLTVTLHCRNPILNDHHLARKPLIAIATGTGIAPIRSLIMDRSEYRHVGDELLFFGCRNKLGDFHFAGQWKMYPKLKVIPAFSRDPEAQGDPTTDPYDTQFLLNTRNDGEPPDDGLSSGLLSYDYDRGKNYVQHLIRKHHMEVCSLISRGAIICLCGNSGKMPLSVREALVDATVLGGLCKDKKEARDFFDGKLLSKIYFWEETW